MSMTRKQLDLAVYFTAVVLAISVFLPLSSLPVIGDVTYNRIADIESYIVITFCVAAVGLLLAGKAKSVVLTAVGVWATFLFPAIRNALQSDDDGFLSRATNQASGKLREFAGDLFLHITDFSWGGYILLVALVGFTIAGVLRTLK
jgi:hypothetical protein